jgi:hypothetical protein
LNEDFQLIHFMERQTLPNSLSLIARAIAAADHGEFAVPAFSVQVVIPGMKLTKSIERVDCGLVKP